MEPSRERVGAVIAAGGSSQRMVGIDKIFASVAGKPLLWHVLQVFQECDVVDQVVVVLKELTVERGVKLVEDGRFSKVVAVCAGGQRRQDSVAEGLKRLERCELVVIHDGARPCVTVDLIRQGVEEASYTGAAIAAVPLRETVKVVDAQGVIESTPRREALWAAQTPQVFRFDLIVEAHRRRKEEVTDDAALVEALGCKVRVYEGSYANIKVTTMEDLALAEIILRARNEGRHRL